MVNLDEIVKKFKEGGYAALSKQEKVVIAYAYTATANVVISRWYEDGEPN